MKCPKCRAEIISNAIKICPYCGSPLAAPPASNKKAEPVKSNETSEIAKMIKEAIETQKAFYKPEKVTTTKKLEKVEKVKKTERKKYSTYDIVIVFVSLVLTFVILAITLSLLLKR